jgi:alpha-glucosidase
MRWDRSPNAGFSQDEPWLPVGPAVAERNVATLKEDEGSLLWLYKRLMELRRAEPALTAGAYVPDRSRNDVLNFRRILGDDGILVALNLKPEPRRLEWQDSGQLLLSTYLDTFHGEALQGPVLLRPDEGVLIKLRM